MVCGYLFSLPLKILNALTCKIMCRVVSVRVVECMELHLILL